MRPGRGRQPEEREEGFTTVFVAGMAVVLLAVWALVGALGTVAAVRHRAEASADLAALAAAKHALEGEVAACAAARRLVVEQAGTLLACRLDGLDAVVLVGVSPPGHLASLGLLRGEARAGRR